MCADISKTNVHYAESKANIKCNLIWLIQVRVLNNGSYQNSYFWILVSDLIRFPNRKLRVEEDLSILEDSVTPKAGKREFLLALLNFCWNSTINHISILEHLDGVIERAIILWWIQFFIEYRCHILNVGEVYFHRIRVYHKFSCQFLCYLTCTRIYGVKTSRNLVCTMQYWQIWTCKLLFSVLFFFLFAMLIFNSFVCSVLLTMCNIVSHIDTVERWHMDTLNQWFSTFSLPEIMNLQLPGFLTIDQAE